MKQKIKELLNPEGRFMRYMQRENRWLATLIGIASLGLVLFAIALIAYFIAPVGAHVLSTTFLVFAFFCFFPGVVGIVMYIRKTKRDRANYSAYRVTDIPPPTFDGEYSATPPQE